MPKYIIYQQKAEPIEILVDPPSAQVLENWEPHAEVPRFRTKGELYNAAVHQDSGYANTAWFLPAPTILDIVWLVQNTPPQRLFTRKIFHPSLYPSQPFLLPTEVIRFIGIPSSSQVGTPSFLRPERSAELFIGGSSFDFLAE